MNYINWLALIILNLLFIHSSKGDTVHLFPNLVKIPIYISYSEDSQWTENEILERFNFNSEMLTKTCGIQLELAQLVKIEDPSLQSLSGYRTPESLLQKKRILSHFPKGLRPVIFYVKNAFSEGEEHPSDFMAQASMLGEPYSLDESKSIPGNIFYDDYADFNFLHGTIVIAEGYSILNKNKAYQLPNRHPLGVETHELGHILLNDAGHNDMNGNYMSYKKRADSFTYEQCLRMRDYPRRELSIHENYLQSYKKLYDYHYKNKKRQ